MRDLVVIAASMAFALAFLAVLLWRRGSCRTPGRWLVLAALAAALVTLKVIHWVVSGSVLSLVFAAGRAAGVAVSIFGYRIAVLRRRLDRM